jgi:hypothetical protein
LNSLRVRPDLSAVIGPGSLDTWIRRRCQRTLFHFTSRGDSRDAWTAPPTDRAVRRLCLLRDGQNRATPCATVRDSESRGGATAPAHEEVRCLDRRRQPYPLEGADQDFLIIDDRWVIRLLYDDHHRLAMGLIVAAGAMDRYRFVRDVFWSAATGCNRGCGRNAPAGGRAARRERDNRPIACAGVIGTLQSQSGG